MLQPETNFSLMSQRPSPPRADGTVLLTSSIVYNQTVSLRSGGSDAFIHPPTERHRTRMKENYLVLEQSVTVDVDVDALVAQIGDALQLHGGGGGGGGVGAHQGSGCGTAGHQAAGGPSGGLKSRGCCLRLRGRGGARGGSRTSPYHVPGPHRDQDWDQLRAWSRRRLSPGDERDKERDQDPQRLLQELLLSGNLIKEAVRRLQISPDCAPFPRAVDGLSCA